jgi:hypothetical protein
MTLDQKIQIWNALGTWLAGLATFAAVFVALYLAKKVEKVKLKVHVGLRVVIEGDGTPPKEHVSFDVTNLSERPVTINSVGWRIGKGKHKRFAMQPTSGRFTSEYPKELAYGKSASFMVSFGHTPNWQSEFANGFVGSKDPKVLKTLTALVHTSVGVTVEAVPEQSLLKFLQEAPGHA